MPRSREVVLVYLALVTGTGPYGALIAIGASLIADGLIHLATRIRHHLAPTPTTRSTP